MFWYPRIPSILCLLQVLKNGLWQQWALSPVSSTGREEQAQLQVCGKGHDA